MISHARVCTCMQTLGGLGAIKHSSVCNKCSESLFLSAPFVCSNYFSPRQKADSLLSLVHQGGQYGYHMLYLCILEDDENPLGHADAAQMLMDYGKRPDWFC